MNLKKCKMRLLILFFVINPNIFPKDNLKSLSQSLAKESKHDLVYCPWRGDYDDDTKKEKRYNSICPFCNIIKSVKKEGSFTKNFVLKLFKYNAILLNSHPYVKGHLLIIPFEHVKQLNELSENAAIELIKLMRHAEKILLEVEKSDGINLGMNIGSAAGASVPNHLHIHVVPRTVNDIGFITTIGNTMPITAALEKTYEKLKPKIDEIRI